MTLVADARFFAIVLGHSVIKELILYWSKSESSSSGNSESPRETYYSWKGMNKLIFVRYSSRYVN